MALLTYKNNHLGGLSFLYYAYNSAPMKGEPLRVANGQIVLLFGEKKRASTSSYIDGHKVATAKKGEIVRARCVCRGYSRSVLLILFRSVVFVNIKRGFCGVFFVGSTGV